jgi:glutamate carboxypeptidase
MILVVLETLAGTRPDFFRRSGWKVLLDATEETDLADFARFSRNESRGCAAFLVFEAGDHSGSDWKLVTSRKGRASYRIEVEGKGAHPGVEHERGANAIVEAARVISRLAALTDYASGLTVNPGLVSGGKAVNRVPDRCVIETELRAFDPDTLERACAAVEAMGGPGSVAAADGSFACRIGVTCTERDAAWPENRGTDSLFAAFSEAATGFGLTLAREARGGLSDGNALAGRLPVIDGLGPSGDNCHCAARAADGSKDAEYANLGDFAKKAALVAEGIAAFASCGENCRGNS